MVYVRFTEEVLRKILYKKAPKKSVLRELLEGMSFVIPQNGEIKYSKSQKNNSKNGNKNCYKRFFHDVYLLEVDNIKYNIKGEERQERKTFL